MKALWVAALGLSFTHVHADSISYRPGQAFLETFDATSVVRVGVSSSSMAAMAAASIIDAAAQGGDLKFTLTNLSLLPAGEAGTALELKAGFKATYKPIGNKLKCRTILVRFALPAVQPLDKPEKFRLLKLHHQFDCEAPGLSGQLWAIVEKQVSDSIEKGVDDLSRKMRKSLFESLGLNEQGQSVDNTPVDAAVRDQLKGSWVQMTGCTRFNHPFLCFTLALPDGSVRGVRDLAVSLAPPAQGPHTAHKEIQAALSAIQEPGLLPRKPSSRFPGYSFPASEKDGKYDEGDLALSGGLICASGDEEGCTVLRMSQSPASGQIWRSPDLVDNPVSPSKSDFSGDQFKGVALFAARSDLAADRTLLQRWLDYITRNRIAIPPGTSPSSAIAYRTCSREVDYACVLSSEEWASLWLIADKHQLSGLPALPVIDGSPFGWSPETLEWGALVSKIGYRTHIVGVQVLFLKLMGVKSDSLQRTAAVLAARQPKNPFYLYLLHGKDASAAAAALDACRIESLEKIQDKHSWAWQHDTSKQAWLDDPMIWDCKFMLSILQ